MDPRSVLEVVGIHWDPSHVLKVVGIHLPGSWPCFRISGDPLTLDPGRYWMGLH